MRKYTDSEGVQQKDGVFCLPADAFRDKQMMAWIMAESHAEDEDPELLEAFNDLQRARFEDRKKAGGLSRLAAFNVRTTGYANLIDDEKVAAQIESGDQVTSDAIQELAHIHGVEKLNAMKPDEFYRLYKNHTSATS